VFSASPVQRVTDTCRLSSDLPKRLFPLDL